MRIFQQACAVFACLAALNAAVAAPSPKYVFLFIGDGMSTPQRMIAEEFARKTTGEGLAMNAMPYQSTARTRSADSLITDSAAAATAIACGAKADNGAIGVAPDGARLESVAEFAKARGRKVGVMTTVTITHATPAGFYAHRRSRSDMSGIVQDLLDSKFDFFAGGGPVCDTVGTKNVFEAAKDAGYRVARSREGFAALNPGCGKVWGVLSENYLEHAIDLAPEQPTLADMVGKAVELLEDAPKGFFIMAEGGLVDYGAHANDAATSLRDVLALDQAVKIACAFQKRHPDETLVVTTGDHETGGMTMGFAGTGYNLYIQLLARQKVSSEKFSERVGEAIRKNPKITFGDIRPWLERDFGFVFDKTAVKTDDDQLMLLSKREIDDLRSAFASDVEFVLGDQKETTEHDVARRRRFAATAKRILSSHAGVGWSTGDHTALPVMTTAIGCGAETITGFLENSDISRKLKELMR